MSFRYKLPQGQRFGLIVEEVPEVNPDLAIYDPDGKPYTIRYDAVNAMLLNEFLKEHRKVQEQEATIAQLKQARGPNLGRKSGAARNARQFAIAAKCVSFNA